MSRKSSKNDRDPRHELSNDFVQALAADWKEHGAAAIEAVREKSNFLDRLLLIGKGN
jgi:hypothetical protein